MMINPSRLNERRWLRPGKEEVNGLSKDGRRTLSRQP